jgi:hypothetical protein
MDLTFRYGGKPNLHANWECLSEGGAVEIGQVGV